MADLTWLRTFMAIYRTRSLTRAAKALHLTQPAISQHLKGLEAQVGWPLFARHPRGVAPTPAGDELAQLVGEHVDALEAIAERMRPPTQAKPGVVHIGGPVDFLATRVLPALSRAIEHGVRVIVHPGLVMEVMEKLARGDLHLAVSERKLDTADLEYEALYDLESVVVVGRARAAELQRLGNDRAAIARSLAAGPFVAFSEEMPLVRELFAEAFGVEVEGRPAVVVPDLRAIGDVIAAGRAVGVLPRPLVERALASGALVEIAASKPGSRQRLWMVTRRGTRLSPRIATIRKLLLAGKG